ncbi:hypothetical protein M569_10200, partial [Genlisea aurea]
IKTGSPDTKLSMASTLGDRVLNNDVKVFVAREAGASLINLMRSNTLPGREAALRALNQISSDDASARILIEAGILPPLVRDLFTVDQRLFPLRLKEVSATILANLVASGDDFDKIPVGVNRQTLVSEEIVHNLLHLINITGPAIESKLLQVLVGLTSSASLVASVVSAVKSSGATNSLVQFVDAPQRDLRIAAVRLLKNLSPHMGSVLAGCLCDTSGQLDALIGVVTENVGITEEQAAAVEFLADLPETDTALTRKMLEQGALGMFIPRIARIRQGDIKGGRFVTPYLEGLVKVLARVTYALSEESSGARAFCRDHNLAAVFIDLLQATGLDNVQVESAVALRNLSRDTKNLTVTPEIPKPGFCGSMFPCWFRTPAAVAGLCQVHDGICSMRETFCLAKGQAADALVSLLDHNNGRVVEASLGALCTLLEDGVNVRGGVHVLSEAEGVNPILDLLLDERNEGVRNKAVWAVERLLTDARIAHQVTCNPNIGTALIDAYQHGDYWTRLAAEKALKRIDKIPNFSGAFPN